MTRKYVFIILLTLCGATQIAMNFKVNKTYHKESIYIIKRSVLVDYVNSKDTSDNVIEV